MVKKWVYQARSCMFRNPHCSGKSYHQSILQTLQAIFDPEFSNSSHGFRPKRSCHGAIKEVRSIINAGYGYAIDIDLEKFFDNVNHDILLHRLTRKVKDKRILRLIGRFLRAGVEENGKILPTVKGVPQGSLCEALHNPPYAK